MLKTRRHLLLVAAVCLWIVTAAFYPFGRVTPAVSADTAETIIACQNLVYNYCRGFDTANLDLVMSIWTDDAQVVFKAAKWDYKGKAQISENFKKTIETSLNPRHVVTNWYWQVQGEKAEANCYFYWHANQKDKPTVVGEGSFHWVFVKQGGAWKISFLEITVDWMKEATTWP